MLNCLFNDRCWHVVVYGDVVENGMLHPFLLGDVLGCENLVVFRPDCLIKFVGVVDSLLVVCLRDVISFDDDCVVGVVYFHRGVRLGNCLVG